MKTKIMIAFLVITLAACAPIQTNTANVQNTAIAIVQTGIALTQTAMPTATLPPSTFTPTFLPTPPATPTPAPPIIPIITPDAIQVEIWKEYQTELAKIILSGYGTTPFSGYALCEWEILGRANQEVYMWAVCDGVSVPAVIYLEADGGIYKVDVPGMNSDWGSDIRRMFPEGVREKFLYRSESVNKMLTHLEWRRMHPEEPPLIVLSVIPTSTPPATPTPAPPTIPILTPDAIQVERWKEYQTELARSIFPNDPPEWFLYKWDILGRSSQKVYVWAVCGVGERSGSIPAVIHLNPDGSILSAEIPWDWSVKNIHEMFPEDVLNKFDYMYAGEIQKMSEHLDWRWAHIGEPPLIILSAMPVATPIP